MRYAALLVQALSDKQQNSAGRLPLHYEPVVRSKIGMQTLFDIQLSSISTPQVVAPLYHKCCAHGQGHTSIAGHTSIS